MYEYIKDKHLLIHPKEDIIGVGDNLWAIDPYSREHSGIHNDEQIVDNGLNPKELFNMMPIIVPENELFIMGDNRDHSNDSRFLVTVPNKNLVVKVTNIFTNFDDYSRCGMKLD